MAAALERYVRDGGHLFVEARPGWQDERGHASATLPGFGWDRLLGVRETEVLPVAQVAVDWGGRVFGGMSFAEHFEPVDPSARVVARFGDGAPAAFERAAGKGRAIILGTFAGERNAVEPVAMHPLGDLLIEWAGVARPSLESSSFVELRRLQAPAGELVLIFNHAAEASRVRLEIPLARPPRAIRELVAGEAGPPGPPGRMGARFRLDAEIPGQRARVYRIDY